MENRRIGAKIRAGRGKSVARKAKVEAKMEAKVEAKVTPSPPPRPRHPPPHLFPVAVPADYPADMSPITSASSVVDTVDKRYRLSIIY